MLPGADKQQSTLGARSGCFRRRWPLYSLLCMRLACCTAAALGGRTGSEGMVSRPMLAAVVSRCCNTATVLHINFSVQTVSRCSGAVPLAQLNCAVHFGSGLHGSLISALCSSGVRWCG